MQYLVFLVKIPTYVHNIYMYVLSFKVSYLNDGLLENTKKKTPKINLKKTSWPRSILGQNEQLRF